jgi:branched-chain amino acid transport system permease protein
VIRTLPWRRVLGLALLGFLAIGFPYFNTMFEFMSGWPLIGWFLEPFRVFQAMRFGVWLVVLMGLNLLTGYNGQISLGYAAFVAVGAYVAAILMTQYGAHVILAVLAAGAFTGVVGFLVGAPALRLSGPYLAIATLALVIALPQVLKHDLVSDWTHASQGINFYEQGTPPVPPEILNDRVDNNQWLYYCAIVPGVIMTVLAWNLTRGRIGRAFMAVRDTELGAEQMGVNVALYKMTAFGISSFYAGIGGALFVFTEAVLAPSTFDVMMSMTMLVMVVLGGLGSILGSIFAAAIMAWRADIVDEIVKLIPRGQEIRIDALRGAIYGGLLVIFILLGPWGLAGSIRRLPKIRDRLVAGKFRFAGVSGIVYPAVRPFLLRRLRGAKSVDPNRQGGEGARDEPHQEGGDTHRP